MGVVPLQPHDGLPVLSHPRGSEEVGVPHELRLRVVGIQIDHNDGIFGLLPRSLDYRSVVFTDVVQFVGLCKEKNIVNYCIVPGKITMVTLESFSYNLSIKVLSTNSTVIRILLSMELSVLFEYDRKL